MFSLSSKCLTHPEEDLAYVCYELNCQQENRLLCDVCRKDHQGHKLETTSAFLNVVNSLLDMNPETDERQLLAKLQTIKSVFTQWYDLCQTHIKQHYCELYDLQALSDMKELLKTNIHENLTKTDCDFLVKLLNSSALEMIQKLQGIKQQLYDQLNEPLNNVETIIRNLSVPNERRKSRKFSQLKQQPLEQKVDAKNLTEKPSRTPEKSMNPNNQVIPLTNTQAMPRQSEIKKNFLEIKNLISTAAQSNNQSQQQIASIQPTPKQSTPITIQERPKAQKLLRSQTKIMAQAEISQNLSKRNSLRQEIYQHTQKRHHCKRSGMETVIQMFVEEDEDGKDWVISNSLGRQETDCQEGSDLNDDMTEICERLYDLGYRDDMHKNLVKGWFVFLW